MAIDPRTEVPDKGVIRALWTGLLLPPIAFLFNLETAYALVPVACQARASLLVHLVHLISFSLAIFGGLVAWRTWQKSGATWSGGEGGIMGRTQFMAGLGVLTAVLFALVIVAQWIPSFILDPCQ
ncbi:MAG TPA: hypothetical protein VD930_10705 [Gemmatimonadales bacterium]|nr:hypothetical protein [Gemmatimonadales bacterium]